LVIQSTQALIFLFEAAFTAQSVIIRQLWLTGKIRSEGAMLINNG